MRERGLPVPMGACLEYASGGGGGVGVFAESWRWISGPSRARVSSGGDRRSWLVRSWLGRRQLSRYTADGSVGIGVREVIVHT